MRVSLQTHNLYRSTQPRQPRVDNSQQIAAVNFEQKAYSPAFCSFLNPDKNNLVTFRDCFFPKPKYPTPRHANFINIISNTDAKIIKEYADKFTDKVLEYADGSTKRRDVRTAIRENLRFLLFAREMVNLPATKEPVIISGIKRANPTLDFQNRYLAFAYMRDRGDKNQQLVFDCLVKVLQDDFKPSHTQTKGEFCRADDPVLDEWEDCVATLVAAAKGSSDTIAEKEAKREKPFPVDNLRQAMRFYGGEKIPYRQV